MNSLNAKDGPAINKTTNIINIFFKAKVYIQFKSLDTIKKSILSIFSSYPGNV